jgi:hypothetical protein
MARLCLLVLLGALTGVLSLNDYWNHFCGKQNCYELLSVPEVSTWIHFMALWAGREYGDENEGCGRTRLGD